MKNLLIKMSSICLISATYLVSAPAFASCDPLVAIHKPVKLANGSIINRKIYLDTNSQTIDRTIEAATPMIAHPELTDCPGGGTGDSNTGEYTPNGIGSSDPMGDPNGAPNPVPNPDPNAGAPQRVPPVVVIGTPIVDSNGAPIPNPIIFFPNPYQPPLFIPVADGGKGQVTGKTTNVKGKVCSVGSTASSTDNDLDRSIAANTLFNSLNKGSTAIYDRIWTAFYQKYGKSATATIDVTFVDGGTEQYKVTWATGSMAITPVAGTLVKGTNPAAGQCTDAKAATSIRFAIQVTYIPPVTPIRTCRTCYVQKIGGN
jgi:hypothetical protein